MIDFPIRIIGGKQKRAFSTPQEEYTRFGSGLIAEYDTNLEGRLCSEYVTPDDLCASDQHCSILFKSGSIKDDLLYVCTQTEIIVYKLPNYDVINHISLPQFNDVHHVVPTDRNTLLVAITGLDLVSEITMDGKVIREWDTLNRPLWDSFNKQIDYRKVLTTKPHMSHPNFVFEYNGEIWVSRFEQKDVQCLSDFTKRIEIGLEKPHDGHLLGNRAYFTTVDGHVVVANMDTLEVERAINLHQCAGFDTATGWARGLKIVDDNHVVVGFSTLRVTKFRENLRWIKKSVGMLDNATVSPTHFALYNLRDKKLIWRKFTNDIGIDVIFSII